MFHYFDTDIAKNHGINAAILFQNLIHWCGIKIANNETHEDGYAYIYNSVAAWADLFPYLSPKQIRSALQKLEDAKLIASRSDLNKLAYDRTKHYGIHASVYAIYTKGQMNLAKKANEFTEKGEPIPDNKHNNKPYSKQEGAIAPTQQAATTRTKKTTTKLEAKNDFEQELIDYRKSIKKPLVTPRGLTSLVNAIHSTAKAWSVHPDVVKNFMMDNEWQSVKPDYSNPFFNPKKQEASQPKPNVRYFDTQEEPKSEPQQDKQAIDKQIDELKDLFGEKI